MKKKIVSVILFLISVVFIILGIVVPNNMEQSYVSYNYKRDQSFTKTTFNITITAGKEYSINGAKLNFETTRGDDLTINVNAADIKVKQENKRYVYSFKVEINDSAIDGMIVKLDDVYLKTANKEIEAEYDISPSSNKFMFVRIIFFILGGTLILAGIFIIIAKKSEAEFMQKVKEDLLKSGKNVENMDDDELIEEWEKTQEQEEAKDFISSVKHLFKDDEPQKPENKVCAYCGTEFGASSNKCPSCGAKLTKK